MEFKLKVILIGDYSCGKTSILKRIRDEVFTESYSTTIGVDYLKKTFNHNDIFNDTTTFDDGRKKYEITREETLKYFKPKNPLFKKYHQINKNISRDDITYNLAIWDTSGQEQFSNIVTAYYRHITSAIIVFDLTNFSSFKSIERWHRDLFYKLDENAHAYFPFIVVGNKSDLKSLRVVSYEKAEELVTKLGGIYVETSAKDNDNILSIFSTLIKAVVFNINHELVTPSSKNGIIVNYLDTELFPRENSILTDDEDEIDSSNRCCNIM